MATKPQSDNKLLHLPNLGEAVALSVHHLQFFFGTCEIQTHDLWGLLT